MLFSKTAGADKLPEFPCLVLHKTPLVVPLPGVIYKIAFERALGDEILGYFKKNEQYRSHFLLTDVKRYNKTTPGISVKSIDSLDRFGQKFDEDEKKSLYICLIPEQSKDLSVGCIAKISGVLMEEETVTISFKASTRATVKAPLLNSGTLIWTSQVLVCNDLSVVENSKDEQRQQIATDFLLLFEYVSDTINSFKKMYKSAAKKRSSQHLLLLSPLSNTLFFQLEKAQFNKAWSTISNQVDKLSIKSEKQCSPETVGEIACLMDLIVAVLPTSTAQKVDFLASLQVSIRNKNFKGILESFGQIFSTMYSSTEYVQRYFSEASNLEKSKLIANQLKSLRLYIEDVKAQNGQYSAHAQGRNVNSLVPSPSAGQKDNDEGDDDGWDEGDDDDDEMEKLKKFIKGLSGLGVHEDGIKMLKKDYKRFMTTNPQSAEYQVLRSYFDVVCDVPFGKYSNRDDIDLDKARRKLDKDHYGLQMVKKRLMEYLCVLKLNANLEHANDEKRKAPILLLVGPPGVGKTSIAKSVAEMLNLKFQRVSLGGVHNEAEIRGHRRTYVGAMCGLIINALRKSGRMNPLILLDEVDKVLSTVGSGSGHGNKINGDPGAALLEVLDPEQNSTFTDHYLGFPVDLSQVLFFCTGNDLAGISKPLLDRMEVIEIPGYTAEEKIQIGSRFLLPKQIRVNGLKACNQNFTLTNQAWSSMVQEYTRESGVRNLERQLATIVRGKIVEYVQDEYSAGHDEVLTRKELYKYLGFPLHPIATELLASVRVADKEGVVNGLSYNSDGTGSVLVFETIKTGSLGKPNGPKIKATGNLGNVLQESIDIGCSVVKSIIRRNLIDGADKSSFEDFLSSEYHLHVPMGAISKDGPSAGTAITLALMSLALKRPVDSLLCMTGEISLRGKILPVGGLKEKLLGAKMYGMKRVLVPIANRSDVVQAVTDDIVPFAEDKSIHAELELAKKKMGLSVTYVNDIYDVIQYSWSDLSLHNLPSTSDHTSYISKI